MYPKVPGPDLSEKPYLAASYDPIESAPGLGMRSMRTCTLFRDSFLVALLCLCFSCSETPSRHSSSTEPVPANPASMAFDPRYRISNEILTSDNQASRQAYFGDLHVHSTYSFDAFAYGSLATPADAYRYAKGEKIRHPGGFDVQLRQPLDFYAVTDHALFLGAVNAISENSGELSTHEPYLRLKNLNAPENMTHDSLGLRSTVMPGLILPALQGIASGVLDIETFNKVAKSTWIKIVDAAEQHNDPGSFTTFIGFEYTTSALDRGNLHRNVIFRAANKLPAMPFSRFHSRNPEGLWDWMDNLRAQGIEALAIPHNSNGSNGQMFKLVDWSGNPLDDDYANQRLRNEPLMEITQIKGTSDTHPALSPNDEWADFEIMPYMVSVDETLESEPAGSYARSALLSGMSLQKEIGVNPYQFGVIGSSDTHNAAISDDESNYFMKMGLRDSTPELRGSVPLTGVALIDAKSFMDAQPEGHQWQSFIDIGGEIYSNGPQIAWGASGLAGVWAEANNRNAIYDAFRRKETFATSGTRIKLRLFTSFNFGQINLDDDDLVTKAYANGVSMGSNLSGNPEDAPTFIAWASQDPTSAALQRLQIIKGWTDAEGQHERVYDIACSDGHDVNPTTHRCPSNNARVNLTDCSISAGKGNAELKTLWRDPDFDPTLHAFYYLRVLENPTCRWSTWDAIRQGVTPREGIAATIQERAWSSPIWYTP